ncbi:MAG: hypothetical protein NWF02_01700 [Candidatus Bathyarchaeota archaeon]|nr:hypothetical protein [Candidatus Bathyarchaeum sp.]
MKNQNLLFAIPLVFALMLQFCLVPVFPSSLDQSNQNSTFSPVYQKGIAFSAWSPDAFSDPMSDESLRLLSETNAQWISLCFSWYQSSTTSNDIAMDPVMSPTVESLQHAIETAHSLGLKVMLKPMVEPKERQEVLSYPVWRGEIEPSDEWFTSYSSFLNYFAEFAQQNNVEMFCVGCEYKTTTVASEQWRNVVEQVRERYSGPLVYAADWTNYENIDWWDCVDYVGIDAYFPLTLFDSDPSLDDLKNVWNNHADDIEKWVSTINMPVIFPEIGYRSGDGTCMAPSNYWADMEVDLQEQSDCYAVAFDALWNRDWFYGFYWWTWSHDPNVGGVTDSFHTPQGKPVQDLITSWYTLERLVAVVDQTFVSSQECEIGETVFVGFHVSWENDASDVNGARVYVNGTEYVTNSSGWTGFNAFYATAGKRTWTVTDLIHSTASGYKIAADNPSVIWDSIVIDIDISEESFGALTFVINVVYGYDGSSVIGANVLANGQTCTETQPGLYEIQLSSWNPIQQVNVVVEGTESSTWYSSSFVNSLNIALIVAVVATVIAVSIIFWIRHKSKTSE